MSARKQLALRLPFPTVKGKDLTPPPYDFVCG